MSSCQKICVTDLKSRFNYSKKKENGSSSGGVLLDLEKLGSGYCKVENTNFVDKYGNVNNGTAPTHKITTHFIKDLDKTYLIELNDKQYTILGIKNIEERNIYQEILLIEANTKIRSTDSTASPIGEVEELQW